MERYNLNWRYKIMNIKFMYNGIKVDGKLYRAYYTAPKMPGGTIVIRAKDYESFPDIPGLRVVNQSNSMLDYFEKDRIYVTPQNRWYQQVFEAYKKMQEHRERIRKRS